MQTKNVSTMDVAEAVLTAWRVAKAYEPAPGKRIPNTAEHLKMELVDVLSDMGFDTWLAEEIVVKVNDDPELTLPAAVAQCSIPITVKWTVVTKYEAVINAQQHGITLADLQANPFSEEAFAVYAELERDNGARSSNWSITDASAKAAAEDEAVQHLINRW